MRINDVIASKGSTVITARSDQSVADLVKLMTQHRIGAVVITDDDQTVTGIAGERDVVRALGERGAAALEATIGEILDRDVHVCVPDGVIASVAAGMTEFRTRHMPVVQGGHFVAIVSIGDIVKSRIDQLQTEQEYLIKYVQS